MANTCAAAGCSNRSTKNKDVNYHRFPKDVKLRKLWLRRIGRPPNQRLTDWDSARVYSKHFPDGFHAHDRDCLPIVQSPGLVQLEQRPSTKRQYPRSLPCRVVDAAQANPDGENFTRS